LREAGDRRPAVAMQRAEKRALRPEHLLGGGVGKPDPPEFAARVVVTGEDRDHRLADRGQHFGRRDRMNARDPDAEAIESGHRQNG